MFGRMVGTGIPVPDKERGITINRSRSRKARKPSVRTEGPSDPAAAFYESVARLSSGEAGAKPSGMDTETVSVMGLDAGRRKRGWSWPFSKLKEFGSEAKSILYSNSSLGA